MLQYIVLLGAVANLAGGFVYIKATLRGETKPNRVTWLIWSVAPLIATVAGLSDGVRWAVLPVFMSGFVPLLVFIVSFVNPKSYWKLEKFDYICGACSILALVLWGITKEPLVAIFSQSPVTVLRRCQRLLNLGNIQTLNQLKLT